MAAAPSAIRALARSDVAHGGHDRTFGYKNHAIDKVADDCERLTVRFHVARQAVGNSVSDWDSDRAAGRQGAGKYR